MARLDISETRAAEMDKLEGTSIQVLQQYFDGERQGGDEVVTARCVLNIVKGNRQTQTAREALRFNMVAAMDDPKVIQRYVKATEPAVRKLLKS